jgi:uncharacterized protein YutE (UPF0331/DUF86 family)
MAELLAKIEAEEENVKKVLEALDIVLGREEFSMVELAASASFIHSIYNGIENILKQVMKEEGVIIPQSGMWHKELLNKAVSRGVIKKKLSSILMEYLAFRHFFVHGYGFQLEEEPIRELGSKIPGIWYEFIKEIRTHVKKG